jgi:hypothetical protein
MQAESLQPSFQIYWDALIPFFREKVLVFGVRQIYSHWFDFDGFEKEGF